LSRKRQKPDPLAVMAANNPVSAVALAAEIGEPEMEAAQARALELGRIPSRPVPPGGRFAVKPERSRGIIFGLAFGSAAVVVFSALLLLGSSLDRPGGGRPAFAAAAIRVAEANPRLLVTAPDWKIVRADEFEPNTGELVFSDGENHLDVHWYPANMYGMYLRDRAEVGVSEQGELLGQPATTVEYSPEEYATMLAPQGNVFIELRGHLGSRSAYEEILHSLRPVDVETWLSAMPAATVRPQDRSLEVDQMLRGIPLPPGFDPAVLQNENSISDRSSLAVKVGNAVACGWVDSWIAARRDGDDVGAERAIEAIAGAPDWPIVLETKSPWFSNYATVVRQLQGGQLDRGPAGYEVRSNGSTFAVGPAWKLALGCGGTWHREVGGSPDGSP
jgi:hypothetical protein